MAETPSSDVVPDVPPEPVQLLMEPLPDLAAWTRYFRDAEIPVLAATSLALEEMRASEDDVDAGMLSALIESDPLMTVGAVIVQNQMQIDVAGKLRV